MSCERIVGELAEKLCSKGNVRSANSEVFVNSVPLSLLNILTVVLNCVFT